MSSSEPPAPIRAEAVIEVGYDAGLTLWPNLGTTGYQLLPLHGDLSDAEIGSAVQAILHWYHLDEDKQPATSLDQYLARVPTDPDPGGIVPMGFGGPQFTDIATGTTIPPACCISLDEREDVYDALDGSARGAYLGHAPDTGITVVDDHATINQEHDDGTSVKIETSVATLREAMAGLEVDVGAFLASLGPWADRHVPGHQQAVVAAVAYAIALDTRSV